MRRFLSLSLVLLLFVVAFAAETVGVPALLKDPAKFDGKPVAVTGKVQEFRQRTSRAGNKYFTFKLGEGKETVNVYGRGELKPPVKYGDRVTATGTFRKEKKLRDFTVKNEIDVSPKSGEKFGVVPAKG